MAEKTQQQQIFIDVFVLECLNKGTEYHTAALMAKEAAGYADSVGVWNIMNTEGVKKGIVEACQSYLTSELPKATRKVIELLDDPTKEGSRRILEVASSIMDRVGLIKKESVEMDIKAPDGVVLLPAKNKDKE